MLHRSSSSRRRRASRSAASSPQTRGSRSAGTSPGRRASIAVSPVDSESVSRTMAAEKRSPRPSMVPDISLDSQDCEESDNPRLSPRNSLVPDTVLSPRNSLVPDNFTSRSPRHSLVPSESYARSPRNSLIPDAAFSPRNSLVPDAYNRSPRNSLVPENINKSPRNSLVPDSNRSPRHSLIPDNNAYSSRINLTPDFNRSPRNSLVPDVGRNQRVSLTPSDSTTWNIKTSLSDDICSRSPRHSIIPDCNRSPRGSIAPDSLQFRNNPRGSITSEYQGDRSPRGSIGPETNHNRSPRGSIGRNLTAETGDVGRSPRGSLTLTFQEPLVTERRSSADNPSGNRVRNTSPYRTNSRGIINQGYNSTAVLSESGSRRASSSVSQVGLPQVSGDEQKRLCSEQKYGVAEHGLGIGISLTTYGSVAYQLKDANLEATGTCDFVCKALTIVNRTVVVTIILIFLSTLPLLMLIMGIQFLRDCPREPHIPVYMVVGGSVGCIKMAWTLWGQLRIRRIDDSLLNATSIGSKVASVGLTVFLIAWFALGNYWILRIKWPDYSPTLFEPNRWCHRTLYVFSLVHLCIIYSVIGLILVLIIMLAGCQLFGSPWLGPTRYK